ncbi:MAG TPA: adenylosuccinate lyase [Firmicutes bacterium]|nr:adenylosuccinate lyase [Bacillota bacterium]
MSAHMIDSYLFGHVVSTDDMREVWDEKNNVQKLLDVEAALARAEASLGIIPKEAAEEICRKAKLEFISLEEVRNGIRKTGHSLVPLLRSLEKACEGDWGQYIHYGATTQDIRDTAMMLQVKEARAIILKDLEGFKQTLSETVRKYAETPMAGRTHGQQALPITFGYKAAVWLDEVTRHIERLKESEHRLLVGNLSGAVGTYASFGPIGPEIEKRVMEQLGLGVPNICWHASRDRFAEFLNILALIASTCGKIANEVFNLQTTEVDEVEEGFTAGKVGSSTMPHKRNPGMSECIVSLAKLVRGNAAVMMQAMEQEHERDGSQWRTEWVLIPESCLYAGCAVRLSNTLVSNLTVKPKKMLENLHLLKGLLLSEPVMFKLAEKTGKQRAHEVVYELSMYSFEKGLPLREVLLKDPRTSGVLSKEEIDQALDPLNYLGLSKDIALRVVKACEGTGAE